VASPVVVDGRLTEEKLTELRSLGGEFAALDHKTTLDMSDTGHKLGLAKDLIAMMNSGGGYVVVGTTDKGEPAHDAEPVRPSRFDSADLAALVAKYIATPPVVTSQAHTLDGRAVVLIHVAATPTGLPAIVTRLGEEQLQSGKKSRILEPGCIYVRQGTANVAATDTHWPLLLENYRAQVVAEARQDIDTLVRRVVESLNDGASGGGGGFRIPLAVEMEDATFAEAVEAHFGTEERERRLRRFLRKMSDLIAIRNEDAEEREEALTKVAIVAVQAIYAESHSVFEAAVRTLHDAYVAAASNEEVDYVSVERARYWLSHLLRLFCIGAVVEREEAWWAVEPLVNRAVGDYYVTWFRHGLVHASRAELLSGGQREGALILVMARDFAVRHPALRDDLGELAELDGDELPSADSMLDSLCRFDIRWCIVAAAANPDEREGKVFYPSCSALKQARAQPALTQLATDAEVRRALLPKDVWALDTHFADAMKTVLHIAVMQSHHHGAWWPGVDADERVETFIEKHASA